MKRPILALCLVLALSTTGCFGKNGAGAAIFATGLILGSAISAAGNHHEETHESAYVEQRHTTTYIIQNPAPAVPAYYAPRPFDAVRARSTLAAVDLVNCRDTGVGAGYGHARVSFNPSGEVTLVVVDEPANLPTAAVECIGGELGKATVPEFGGSTVTVGTTWMVR